MIAALVVARSSGGDAATADTYESGTTRCTVDHEYCLYIAADAKKGTAASYACIANPCGGTMTCDCIEADSRVRRPTCSGACDLRNTSGVVTHAFVSCTETAM